MNFALVTQLNTGSLHIYFSIDILKVEILVCTYDYVIDEMDITPRWLHIDYSLNTVQIHGKVTVLLLSFGYYR